MQGGIDIDIRVVMVCAEQTWPHNAGTQCSENELLLLPATANVTHHSIYTQVSLCLMAGQDKSYIDK